MMEYILGRIISWNVKFEKISNTCILVYGNFDAFTVKQAREGWIDVDGKLMNYDDFEDLLYRIKQ